MDDHDFNFRDVTFPTGIDSAIEDDDSERLRLPDVVNFVALRETCLSEAPFVNRATRKFWKKWMDSSQYITILCATLKILTSCMNDSGHVDAKILYQREGNPLMQQMSMCIAEMLVMDRKRFSRQHDMLFRKLPELLCYMLVNSLHSCNPRQSRVFNSIKFRELLLDWLGEMIGGIRLTNCQSERRWLFSDATDGHVTVNNNEFLTSLVPKPKVSRTALTLKSPRRAGGFMATSASLNSILLPSLDGTERNSMYFNASGNVNGNVNGAADTGPLKPGMSSRNIGTAAVAATPASAEGGTFDGTLAAGAGGAGGAGGGGFNAAARRTATVGVNGGATCHFDVGNSPLVSIYLNLGRTAADHPYKCAHPVRLVLTAQPDRPLTSMTPDSLVKAGNFREKRITPGSFLSTMKESSNNRKAILKEFETQQRLHRREIEHQNKTLKMQFALLENKNLDTKHHILASSTSMDPLRFNATGSVGGSVGSESKL
jgi:hypothetical protein